MSSAQRAVVLTNNDPNITYIGEWTTIDASTLSDSGGWGAAFSPTLHVTKTNSSFSFPFHGSTILVIGTDNVANISTNPDPTWQCFIDDTSLGPPILRAPIQNNWVMCTDTSLSDGLHELTVNVTSHGMPFYLDTLQYRASPSVSLENSLVAIYPGDPAIDLISGWSPSTQGGNQTSDPNGIVNLTFIDCTGTQLSWYGFLPAGPTSSGEWSIDGDPFQSFQVTNLIPDTSNSGDNQLFFMTPILDMGTHELLVKYTGTEGQIPLILEYLFIKNGSFPASLPSSSPMSSGGANSSEPPTLTPPSNTVPPLVDSEHSLSTAGIVGEVVGSIIGMTIIVVIAFVWFKFNGRRRQTPRFTGLIESIQVTPYQPPFVPPLQTSQVPKDHAPALRRNAVSTEYLNPINPVSLFTIVPQSNPPATTVLTETDPSRYPLPVTAIHSPPAEVLLESRFIIQYEDSGLRFGSPAVREATEVPPTYTEQ